MLIKPDFSQTQDTVSAGIYKVRVLKGELGEWEGRDGKPNTAFINWQLETFGEDEEKNNGRRIFHKTPFTGGGAFRFQEFYKAARGEDFPDGKEFDIESLYGCELEVTVVDGVNRQTGQPTGFTDVKACKPLT